MKHINITNWQGNITDWTKLNYVYGGLEDSIADRVNLRIPGTNLRNYVKKGDNLINYKDIDSIKFTDLGNNSFKLDWRGAVSTITLPYNDFNENTQYSITITKVSGAGYWAYQFFWNYTDNTSERFTNNQGVDNGTYSFTSALNKTLSSITIVLNYEADFKDLMLNVGKPKSFEPYGSMVLVENVSRAYIDSSWEFEASIGRIFTSVSDIVEGATRTVSLFMNGYNCLSNGEAYDSTWNKIIYNGSPTRIYVTNKSYKTKDEWIANEGNNQIIYPLATPKTTFINK